MARRNTKEEGGFRILIAGAVLAVATLACGNPPVSPGGSTDDVAATSAAPNPDKPFVVVPTGPGGIGIQNTGK